MIKKLLKILGILILVIFLFVAGFCYLNYHSDIPVEELKKTLTFPDSKFVEIEGMDVHYRITGEGKSLILLHGTASSLHTWKKWTEHLSDDFQIISVDMPGFGLTGPHPNSEFSIDMYIRFLNAFTSKIGVDKFSMAGNSLGGNVIWNYSIKHPEKIEKIILIGASGYAYDKDLPKPLAIHIAENPITAKLLLRITPRALVHESVLDVYADDSKVTDEIVDKYFYHVLRPGNRQAFVDRVTNINVVTPERIKLVPVPTLVMWGEEDTWVPVEWARNFHRDIQNSQLIIYQDVGHIPMEEIPAISSADAKKFLLEPLNNSNYE